MMQKTGESKVFQIVRGRRKILSWDFDGDKCYLSSLISG